MSRLSNSTEKSHLSFSYSVICTKSDLHTKHEYKIDRSVISASQQEFDRMTMMTSYRENGQHTHQPPAHASLSMRFVSMTPSEMGGMDPSLVQSHPVLPQATQYATYFPKAAKPSAPDEGQFEDAPEEQEEIPPMSTKRIMDPLWQLATAASHAGKSPECSSMFAEVGQNDVLCGRGGLTNHHPGNIFFRKLVRQLQTDYLRASKRDKAGIARKIVEIIRCQNPPGRFLKKDAANPGVWIDIGNRKAREKTSQALREGAPELREVVISGGEDNVVPTRSVTPPLRTTIRSKRSIDEISEPSSPQRHQTSRDENALTNSPRGPRLRILKSRTAEDAI